MNAAGKVVGRSARYNGGSTQLGDSAWIYDGAATTRLGFAGGLFTATNGTQFSIADDMNEAGQVIGHSRRYDGPQSVTFGQSAWFYDGTTTIDIGLNDAEHTRSDGAKSSSASQLNEAGQVRGHSARYVGSTIGQSAWFYDGATTILIGLTGSEHSRNDGYKRNLDEQMNEQGHVLGYAERYNGGSTSLGRDAWFYDPVLDQTFPLQLSVRSDGYAFSSASYLGEDGLTLGYYTLFDALDNNLGYRAFYFTPDDGLHDLAALVAGGLGANGWDHLASTIRENGAGQILGHGRLTSQSAGAMAYLLTPIIPEPSSLTLAAVSVCMFACRARSVRGKRRTRKVIQDNTFAKEWIGEAKRGGKNFKAMLIGVIR